MKYKIADYSYILLTIIFTVYGQLILKWRVTHYGALPTDPTDKLKHLFLLLLDPLILSGFVAAFLASLCWMAAMTKFPLSYAYPFMSLNFAIVLLLSVSMLQEPLNLGRTLGVALIIAGTVLAARSA